jgi:hypothetical protein
VPLADFADYEARLRENVAADFQMATAFGGGGGRLFSGWNRFVLAPLAPGASTALTRASAEAIGSIPALGADGMTILGARVNTSATAGQAVILADLLNISGGLSADTTSAQVLNLPTAALTRYTTGAGVVAGIVISTQIGDTATTATVDYVNQAGNAATSPAFQIGAPGYREAGRVLTVPLAPGDTGVRSVTSVTLALSTGTAGAFGVCLWKPLAMLCCNSVDGAHVIDAVSSGGFIGALAGVDANACLTILGVGAASQAVVGAVLLAAR